MQGLFRGPGAAYITIIRSRPRWAFFLQVMKMSAIDASRGRVVGVHGVVARVLGMLSAWNEARVTRYELTRLSDRELDDIGLARGDIERVARGA